jgi:hypothetical protein
LPLLTRDQAAQLRLIEPTSPGCYPCQVLLKDGRLIDRVLVIAAGNLAPDWSPGSRDLRVEDVAEFQESPFRVPAPLARRAEGEESGMGYLIFTLVLEDGRRLPYSSGGLVDFAHLPDGVTSDMIVDLVLHEGREATGWGNPLTSMINSPLCPFIWPPQSDL